MNEANKLICDRLGLPEPGPFSQDWEYELPKTFRTTEWVEKYITYYLENSCSMGEKEIMMTLLLDIANGYEKASINELQVKRIFDLLIKNHKIHWDLIEYWTVEESSLEDAFAITPKIRALKLRLESEMQKKK
ncbi:hypothetical protein F2P45_34095 [Massilia sp. CCM 8733]|uniref:Uncharacterized protein n=1 Tax=Massilia mucilaginosa TaxID=2609282 RepID=A0ABX0P6D2_9BURK|nr:hypothetical protein [Massilia mucilaginosa]NHZ93987.1 hypothetical protein [Massilia mucilaginosa]